jgi:hypothetical protein
MVQTESLTHLAEVIQSALPRTTQPTDSSVTAEADDSEEQNTGVIRGHGGCSQQALRQVAAQIATEIVAMAYNMEAKLSELPASGYAKVHDDCDFALVAKRIKLESIHDEHLAKRRRLFEDYDDTVSRLIKQSTSTKLKIATAARVSTSPSAPTKENDCGTAGLSFSC